MFFQIIIKGLILPMLIQNFQNSKTFLNLLLCCKEQKEMMQQKESIAKNLEQPQKIFFCEMKLFRLFFALCLNISTQKVKGNQGSYLLCGELDRGFQIMFSLETLGAEKYWVHGLTGAAEKLLKLLGLLKNF